MWSSAAQASADSSTGPPLPWSLRSGGRLLATLALSLGLVTGLFDYLISTRVDRVLASLTEHYNQVTAQLVAPVVAEHFDSLIHYLESYARRQDLTSAVARHDAAAVRAHLAELVQGHPQVDGALVTDTRGALWADYPPVPGAQGKTLPGSDWFNVVAGGGASYVSGIYPRTGPPPRYVVAVATPLRGRRGEVLGYLVEQQGVPALDRWLAQIEVPGEGAVALVDGQGRLVASDDSAQRAPLSLARRPLLMAALAGHSGSEELPDPVTGRDSLVGYSPVTSIGWVVLVRKPMEAVLAPVGAVQRALLGFALAFLLVMTVLGFVWLNTVRLYNLALRERAARFRGLLESAPEAIVVVDRDGLMVLVNSQVEHWFGYPRAELLGRPVAMLVPQALAEQAGPDGAHSFLAPRPLGADLELKGRRSDGSEFPIEVSLSPLNNKGDRLVTAVIRDISERKRQEEALRQYTLQLEAANRELESFSYSVSHDLRTPLRAIDGFSHVLLDDCGEHLSDQCRDYLRRVRAASQRMAMLIDDLLNLATVTRADLVTGTVNLSCLAKEAIEALRNAEPDREVEVAITPDLCVNGDERLLRIAMENLISNAWKFTANRRPGRIEFGLAESSGRQVYRVRDNGAGFDMAYADKLFAPFQRLHDQSEFAGTGIGLATVQRILRKHGGQIWAEGVPGKGASFCFTL